MVITEVRIKLCEENNERLLAFCSITFDNAFVVRDLKIIEGTRGIFVAMPSRKLTDRCTHCSCKNHMRARFCNSCGQRLDENRAIKGIEGGRAKLHADIAHPIHAGARELCQSAIVRAFHDEKQRSMQPGYVCRYDDYDTDFDDLDAAISYGHMVTELSKQYKSHAGHAPAAKGPHTADREGVSTGSRRQDDFAAGIS